MRSWFLVVEMGYVDRELLRRLRASMEDREVREALELYEFIEQLCDRRSKLLTEVLQRTSSMFLTTDLLRLRLLISLSKVVGP